MQLTQRLQVGYNSSAGLALGGYTFRGDLKSTVIGKDCQLLWCWIVHELSSCPDAQKGDKVASADITHSFFCCSPIIFTPGQKSEEGCDDVLHHLWWVSKCLKLGNVCLTEFGRHLDTHSGSGLSQFIGGFIEIWIVRQGLDYDLLFDKALFDILSWTLRR